jgi:hypothetical protein
MVLRQLGYGMGTLTFSLKYQARIKRASVPWYCSPKLSPLLRLLPTLTYQGVCSRNLKELNLMQRLAFGVFHWSP